MILRALLLAASLIVTGAYVWTMHQVNVDQWNWEQRAMAVLLISLFMTNNPLFPFIFVAKGWFFPFLVSLFQTGFLSVLLLFWLLITDKIRNEENMPTFSWILIPKLLIVTVWGILSLALFAVISIRDERDPVYGTSVTSFQILFYVVAVFWIIIVLWVAVLVALTIPVVVRQRYLVTRFLFFGLPTMVCIFSIFASVLSGSFGPYGETAIGFVYFLFLYNVYVFILAWGYWPVKETTFNGRNPVLPGETSPLSANFDTRPTPNSEL